MSMNKFKNLIFLLYFFIIMVYPANAVIIVYPEKTEMTVNDNSVFFCGNSEDLQNFYINNELIIPEENGAFAHHFILKDGINTFDVKSLSNEAKDTVRYTIKRVKKNNSANSGEFQPLEKKFYITKCDNAILRSSPVDAGMNRMGYLPCGTKVIVDGKKNGFLRVYLSKNNFGWINLNHLTKSDLPYVYRPIKILDSKNNCTDSEITYEFELSENCPYSAECINNVLRVKLFNVNTDSEEYLQEFPLFKLPRYSVRMSDNRLIVTLKKSPFDKSFFDKNEIIIVVDPGHGGNERGAVGCFGDKEKDINLAVGKKLKELLSQYGYTVYLTRENDSFISLNDRVKFAQKMNAMLFVSIHLNCVPLSFNPNNYEGTEVYYFNPQSKQSAKFVVNNISKELCVRNNGVKQASFAVVRPTEYIGILTELLFLVNPKDTLVYKNASFVDRAAIGICNGIEEYIDSLSKL